MPTSQRHRSAIAVTVIALVMGASMSHYTVEPGDTLSRIAADHGLTVAEIAEANGITNPDLIHVGQVLDIHGGTTSALDAEPAGPIAITHVVSPGDTLASIAARYGTTSGALMALNGITNPNLIYAGTVIIVQGSIPTELPSVSTGVSGTHTVQTGETLSEIAGVYGVSVTELMAANGIDDPDFIRAGDVLAVAGGRPGFRCPVPGATFFNDFGFPRSDGRYHEGNDLFAPRGTPVVAPVSGFVHHLVGDLGGLQFRLDGDDGHRYIGTHLDSFGVSGKVGAGEVIGFVGDSGNALGSSPHLHFEIHLDRVNVTNPYPLLAEACG